MNQTPQTHEIEDPVHFKLMTVSLATAPEAEICPKGLGIKVRWAVLPGQGFWNGHDGIIPYGIEKACFVADLP